MILEVALAVLIVAVLALCRRTINRAAREERDCRRHNRRNH